MELKIVQFPYKGEQRAALHFEKKIEIDGRVVVGYGSITGDPKGTYGSVATLVVYNDSRPSEHRRLEENGITTLSLGNDFGVALVKVQQLLDAEIEALIASSAAQAVPVAA